MTSITATSNGAGTGPQASQSTEKSSISSDFSTWMTLLTAQLRNQDPFDPVDSTEYTAQLAQFSAVEQQVRTNDLLTELVSASASSDMTGMAEWIGKEVRINAAASFDGQPVMVFSNANVLADRAELVVRDRYGNEVDRFAVATGETETKWDGRSSTGEEFPRGMYSFHVESFDANGKPLETADAEIFALVREVRREGDQISLVLPGGILAGTASVSAVRTLRA